MGPPHKQRLLLPPWHGPRHAMRLLDLRPPHRIQLNGSWSLSAVSPNRCVVVVVCDTHERNGAAEAAATALAATALEGATIEPAGGGLAMGAEVGAAVRVVPFGAVTGRAGIAPIRSAREAVGRVWADELVSPLPSTAAVSAVAVSVRCSHGSCGSNSCGGGCCCGDGGCCCCCGGGCGGAHETKSPCLGSAGARLPAADPQALLAAVAAASLTGVTVCCLCGCCKRR